MPARESLSKTVDRVRNSTPLSRLMPGNGLSLAAMAIPDGAQPGRIKSIWPIIAEQLFHALPSIDLAVVTSVIESGLQEAVNRTSQAVLEDDKLLLSVGFQKGSDEDIYFIFFFSCADRQAVQKAFIRQNQLRIIMDDIR